MITCFVVVGEWEYGIRNALGVKRQWEIREQGAKIFGSLFDIVESSQEINLTYGEISAELRREGAMIPQNDIWIVATARVVGATVVASDKHFKRVKNLSMVDWTAS